MIDQNPSGSEQVQRPSLPPFILPVFAGSSDTLLSAARGNEIMRTCRAITMLAGDNQHLFVHQSDSHPTIELTNWPDFTSHDPTPESTES
jgi:hypothetical protein